MFDPVQAHFDLADRLRYDPFFATIPVKTEYPRTLSPGSFIVNRIEQLLAVLRGNGAGFLVLMPSLTTSAEKTNSPGPTMTVKFSGLAFTNEILSAATGGAKKRCIEIVDRARLLWHQFSAVNAFNPLGVTSIEPERLQGVPKELAEMLREAGFVAWGLEAICLLSLDQVAQCPIPTLSPRTGVVPQTVTITSNDVVWYTTDGSYPGPSNGLAAAQGKLYTEPISITTACTLRAVAYDAAGIRKASDLNAGIYSAE